MSGASGQPSGGASGNGQGGLSGAGGSDAGSGGSDAGSGGSDAGSGDAGDGGSDAGAGGDSAGGSDAGSAGSDAGSGGSDAGAGGDAGSSGEGGTASGGAGQGGSSTGGGTGQGGQGMGGSGTSGQSGTGQGGAGQGGSGGGGTGSGGAGQGGQVGGVCGDGVIQVGEACDDGNANNNDACDSNCKLSCSGPDYKLNATTGHCYYLGKNSVTWEQARAACLALGPGFDLAALSTTTELSQITETFFGIFGSPLWLGGNDRKTEGTFAWTNGETWTYPSKSSPWSAGEPDGGTAENCVQTGGFQNISKIVDEPCFSSALYLCERPQITGPLCRNNVLEAGEECDDGNLISSDGCGVDCVKQTCGDGVVQGDEECDDANQNPLDECDNNCKFTCGPDFFSDPSTGHCYFYSSKQLNWAAARQACFLLGPGYDLAAPSTIPELNFVESKLGPNSGEKSNIWLGGTDAAVEGTFVWSNGETWNYPPSAPPWTGSSSGALDCIVLENLGGIDDNSCSSSEPFLCERSALSENLCRDGVKGPNEACDDGNQSNTDACTNACIPASCGDGFVHQGVEECDDGDQSNTNACVTGCKLAKCGDGFVRSGVEQCDDGNNTDGDGCQSDCKTVCGDGLIIGIEQCEDGNNVNTDACVNCQNAKCGDGFVRAGVEECDDSNSVNTDACVTGCKKAKCGDGFVQAGIETCDDGNTTDGDGCNSTCSGP